MRKPIDTAGKHFAGNLFVNFINDGEIVAHIVRYLEDTVTRSIAKAVEEGIRDNLASEFLRQEWEVSNKMNHLPLPNFDVRLVGDTKGNDFIEVARRGTKSSEDLRTRLNRASSPRMSMSMHLLNIYCFEDDRAAMIPTRNPDRSWYASYLGR